MNKNKLLTLSLIGLSLSMGFLFCGCSSSSTIKILEEKKCAWNDADNNDAFTFGMNIPTTSFTGTGQFAYTQEFSDFLSLKATSTAPFHINQNSYFKFWRFFFGEATNDNNLIQNKIDNFIATGDKRNTILDSNIVYKYALNPSYQIIVEQQFINNIYYYDFSDGTPVLKYREMVIEDYETLAQFDKSQWLLLFYGNNDQALINNFVKIETDLKITIKATDLFGNFLEGETFKKNRPQNDKGEALEMLYRFSGFYNYFAMNENEIMTTQKVNRIVDNNTINLNEQEQTSLNLSFQITLFDNLHINLLGLKGERIPLYSNEWKVTGFSFNANTTYYNQPLSHNMLIISHSFNNQAVDDYKTSKEADYQGYVRGLKEGQDQWNWDGFLGSIFKAIDKFLEVEILPNFKLWYFFGIPIVFGLLKFIISWFR